MNHSDIVNAIHHILRDIMFIPQIDAFEEHARLNEDLYLDSVLVLELLLNLETELNFEVPDDVLTKDDFDTVSSLARFLSRRLAGQEAPIETHAPATMQDDVQEEFEDIKVHCFVSCICEIIKADPRVDHRPFYFGVWDAEVVVDNQFRLSYHSEELNHDFFRHWYQTLYGVETHAWYQARADKADNIQTLQSLLRYKPEQRQVMVMLDMYRLPERENKFNQNPFPHYVLLSGTEDPEIWFMNDPDFRWEGRLPKDKILHAIESPHVAGGYYFSSNEIRETSPQYIHDYFQACIHPYHNLMTDAIRRILDAHLNGWNNLSLSALPEALKQIPVLAIRKYAYEHGFAFFWRDMLLDDDAFEAWCVIIEALVETYKLIQFRAMKIARAGSADEADPAVVRELYDLLEQQDEREFHIKKHLIAIFERWKEIHILPRRRILERPLVSDRANA